jgi:hypothetical protein
MTPSNRTGLFPHLANATWTLYAYHDKVKRWVPLFTGARHSIALDEMLTRQDRVRRSGEPCRFVMRPDGQRPN